MKVKRKEEGWMGAPTVIRYNTDLTNQDLVIKLVQSRHLVVLKTLLWSQRPVDDVIVGSCSTTTTTTPPQQQTIIMSVKTAAASSSSSSSNDDDKQRRQRRQRTSKAEQCENKSKYSTVLIAEGRKEGRRPVWMFVFCSLNICVVHCSVGGQVSSAPGGFVCWWVKPRFLC